MDHFCVNGEEDQRYLNSSTSGRVPPPTQRLQTTIFQSAYWTCWLHEANKNQNMTKKQTCSHVFLIPGPCSHWGLYEIKSLKITHQNSWQTAAMPESNMRLEVRPPLFQDSTCGLVLVELPWTLKHPAKKLVQFFLWIPNSMTDRLLK